jgi:energy-coupling factor transport system ATP-binding protein
MGISFEQVTYRYHDGRSRPTLALDSLNLELEEQRFIAVLGAPGSGKSTMLQLLNGLLKADEGHVQILDYVLESTEDALEGLKQKRLSKREKRKRLAVSQVPSGLRRRVGLVFQFPEHQLFEATVEQDLRFGPLNFGASEEEATLAARRAAETMGLGEELLARSPFELSSGQMRKAAIASVLAAEPDVLVLDEPTASLDALSREELMHMLQAQCKVQGRTVIIVTHRLEEVMTVADQFIVLGKGKVLFQGNGADLLSCPDVLEEAGIMPPRSVRLAGAIAQRLGLSAPERVLDASALAEWISNNDS